jgi:adenylyl cyclase-associated protein
MTHKNPELRAGGTVPDSAVKKSPPAVKAKPGSLTQPKKPAKLELEEGNKWMIVSCSAFPVT